MPNNGEGWASDRHMGMIQALAFPESRIGKELVTRELLSPNDLLGSYPHPNCQCASAPVSDPALAGAASQQDPEKIEWERSFCEAKTEYYIAGGKVRVVDRRRF